MKDIRKIVWYGFLTWFIPFIASFPFVDPQTGEFIIDEIFFKSIMVVVGSLTGVIFIVRYFKDVTRDYVKVAFTIGAVWILMNWLLDLIFVSLGFFDMTYIEWFTQIGLRYVALFIYAVGAGYLLNQTKK